MEKWKTSISRSDDRETLVRGYELLDLIGNLSFSEAVCLLLKGELPKENESKMLDAILVACIEHGINPPSITSARASVSAGNPVNAALAAGMLGFGEFHGGAIEQCAKMMQESVDRNPVDVVKRFKEQGKRIPGYGHAVYKDEDPRTAKLFSLASQYDIAGKHVEFAHGIRDAIDSVLGKTLCINIDGAIAALISEMGFDWRIGKGLFAIPRSVGMLAHIHEEMVNEKPYRRLDNDQIEYIGPGKRELKRK
ncbi:MAG: citryl-CoA lyase [Candidatus Aenigmarchaeota archaeon]|nr:citryl-CoA lyase [Candidatus Aenigmarchaeota archaeon]